MKGQIARRAMELGGWPVRTMEEHPTTPFIEETAPVTQEAWDDLSTLPPSWEVLAPNLPRIRLMKTIRRLDPLMADLIESLAPVYLVKK